MEMSSEIFIGLDCNQSQWDEFASNMSDLKLPTQQICINEILQDWMIILIMRKRNYNIWCWNVQLNAIPFWCKFFKDSSQTYGSGHETVAVMLPGFAINW